MNVVDCFPDGHGNYTSKLVPFKKFLQNNNFLNAEEICLKALVVQVI